MAESNIHPPGTFCWADLAAVDSGRAKQFYGRLFDWRAHRIQVGPGNFTMFQLGGKEVASLYQLSEQQLAQGVPAHWMAYVSVGSADNTAEQARSLGGQIIVEPFDVLDPTGAPFALWQRGRHPGLRRTNQPGTLAWSELLTNDPVNAAQFYSQLFGWNIQAHNGSLISYNMGRRIAGIRQITEAWGNMWRSGWSILP